MALLKACSSLTGLQFCPWIYSHGESTEEKHSSFSLRSYPCSWNMKNLKEKEVKLEREMENDGQGEREGGPHYKMFPM